MVRFDASSAECLVFTCKEGLLSAVAHDLKLRVNKFVITVDEQTRAIEARFDAASLRVVCTMRGGTEWAAGLSAANKREIETNIARDVLAVHSFPEIVFVSTAVQEKTRVYVIKGTLDLHGTQRAITVQARKEGQRYVAEAQLHQPDFGIRPYTALLGTLKVQPDVTVRVSVPALAPAH